MSFLTPLFFLGLGAIAIPILVHLIQRQKKDVVHFPSLMFVQRIPYQSVQRRRIRHWFLLLMRAAAIALIAMAFARPFLAERAAAQIAAIGGNKELVVMVGWGYAARANGVIPVDREAGAAAMRRMIAAARAAKTSNRPVVLFPEGTRVPHGERPALRAGLAGLYKVLDLPVIPIALDSGKVWPRGGLIRKPGVVTMKVGETIPAGLPREEIEARVHAAINVLNT